MKKKVLTLAIAVLICVGIAAIDGMNLYSTTSGSGGEDVPIYIGD